MTTRALNWNCDFHHGICQRRRQPKGAIGKFCTITVTIGSVKAVRTAEIKEQVRLRARRAPTVWGRSEFNSAVVMA